MKATSSYTRELIEQRLAWLRAQEQTPQVAEEIAYLTQLKARRGWDN